jgi:quinol monooxygenase YgiN
MGDLYGTVARLKVKPGHLEQLKADQEERAWPKGGLAMYAYQLDDNPDELLLAVVFEDEESYKANADLPETHQEYLKLLEHLEGEPEWHDGKVVVARTA